MTEKKKADSIRDKIHEIIFEADTPMGKLFDIVLLLTITLSVLVVMLESVAPLQAKYARIFISVEWFFTVIFTIEYLLRLYSVKRAWSYATSFFGVIDLLAILPAYLSFFFTGGKYLLIIRALRLMRIFRIFKLGHFLYEGQAISKAIRASFAKITIFLTFVVLLVIIIGAVMYLIEGGNNEGFSSIPRSIYWAIVTLTTVGYGDITPRTDVGQFFSAAVMLLGYAIIAVPTGIVSAEFIRDARRNLHTTQVCRYCNREGHESDAVYCKFCGERLNP
ncbi:MAG TPA: ion transporter [Saprospiraceae bacterium]|nr:ion transporter [Saprospiraceae bacterium]HMQ84106.1 ion transporter [Saprospiraceae bacterium]